MAKVPDRAQDKGERQTPHLDTGRADGEPDHMDVDNAASLLEALGSPVRLRILIELRQAGDDGLSVGTLQERLGIDAKSTLSNHLRQLVHAGLVTQERRSTTLLCRAPAGPLAHLLDFLARLAPHPDGIRSS